MRLNTLFGNQAVGLMLLLWSTVAINGVAQQSISKAARQPYSLEVTSKIHTAGHSLYSGMYLNHHANMEMNVTYKNKQIGAFVSKYVDFVDIHSRINYATVGLFKSFRLGESVKLTPYLGYFFVQANSLMDKPSDLWAAMVIRFTINERIWVENTTLAGNLLHHRASVSLANRLNAAMLMGKLRLDIYTWYTHSLHTATSFCICQPWGHIARHGYSPRLYP